MTDIIKGGQGCLSHPSAGTGCGNGSEQFLKFNPAGSRLHPSDLSAFVKPFVRKAPPSDKNRVFGPSDYLFVSVMQSSKTGGITAQIGMVFHGLFAIGGFYFSLKPG